MILTTTAWLRRTVSLITATVLVGCGGSTHQLGKAPDAAVSSALGGNTAVTGSGGTSAVDAPRGGVGGTSSDVGGAGMGGSVKSGGMSASTGAISSGNAGVGGSRSSSAAGGSSASSASCCSTSECPSGYYKVGDISTPCPAGAVCEIFTTSCGCNRVMCKKLDAGSSGGAGAGGSGGKGGVDGGAGSSAGRSGGAGGGGTITSGASSGSPCPDAPSCNWCNGIPVHGDDGCIYEYRCANGIDPCSKIPPCTDSSGCDVGYTCIDRLCWRGDAGVGGSGGTGGTGGSGGTSGSSSTCMPPTSCNWCGGEMLKDANGCFAGYRCANGADACKVSPCSATAPCPSGQTCRDMLCWPGDGGAGGDGGTTVPGCGYQCQTLGGVTGWYLNNQLVCEAACQDCKVSCENVGTWSEGCYSTCGGTVSAGCASFGRAGLINYMFCSNP